MYTRIIHKAADELIDRLENGDAVLIEGAVKRRPVSARDLAMINGIIYDKRALARNEPTGITSQDRGYNNRDLCLALAEIVRKREQAEGKPVED